MEQEPIVKIVSAMLIAAITLAVAWRFGLDRHGQVVGSSIEATELWRNPWPAPGARN